MSPREVLQKHTSRDLSEWVAYASLHPFGLIQRDTALMAWQFASANHDPKQGKAKGFDWFLGNAKPERAATREEIRAFFTGAGQMSPTAENRPEAEVTY